MHQKHLLIHLFKLPNFLLIITKSHQTDETIFQKNSYKITYTRVKIDFKTQRHNGRHDHDSRCREFNQALTPTPGTSFEMSSSIY
jgi:hypothetical protein